MLESMLNNWGGENLIIHRDVPTDSWFLIALHSSRLGPATGRTRMKPYPNLQAPLRIHAIYRQA